MTQGRQQPKLVSLQRKVNFDNDSCSLFKKKILSNFFLPSYHYKAATELKLIYYPPT